MNSDNRVKVTKRFWDWFTNSEGHLKTLYASEQFESLASELNHQLDRVEPLLAWEIGAGVKKPYMLTISAEGNQNLRELAEFMVAGAPEVDGWEFYSSRPARPAPKAVQLPESGEQFETSEWEFIPVERPEQRGLDLVIVGDQLASADRDTALKAVSLFLDQTLGEDVVETWIGKLSVESRAAVHGKKSYKVAELPDYLLWITHREVNPLMRLGRVQ
ncbi:MAG: hypothetical protein WAK20_12180 [Candidatus Acidiferrum sp.]